MDQPLVSLLYISRATPQFRDEELPALLASATVRNEQRGITGVLLSYAGRFMQVLEGPQPVVQACFDRISRDPRHGPVVQVALEPIEARRFPSWAMRDVQPPHGSDRAVMAFLDQLEARATPADCHAALLLLQRLAATRA